MRKFIFLILALLLTACGASQTAVPTATPDIASAVAATMTALSPTPAATRVSTSSSPAAPQGPGKVILVAPESAGSLSQPAREALATLAASAQWAVETRPALAAADLKPEFKLVIFLQAPPDLPGLLSAAPQTQFVALGGSELEAKGNLSVIRQREEFRSFMGGYITTLIAPDWRSLGLLPNAPANLQDAFLNGGRYWCGRCIPVHGPVVLFPLVSALAPGAGAGEWQQAVTGQQKNVLEAVYLSPTAHSPELVKNLFTQKLLLVGSAYPGDEYSRLWAATLRFDPLPALQKLWPSLAAGKGGQSADAGLSWVNVNEDLFSVGRQRLAQQALAGLLDGTISPFSVPAQ